jgi:threonylcarbamoyladenosine tRNA methylthiotransferase MtaB
MKIFIKTFGCRVNQSESQAVLEQFLAEGYTPTDIFEDADLCLLNTCSVTHKADRDALHEIRKIARGNPRARLVITGCFAMTQKDKITAQFPNAQVIFKADLGKELFGREIDWTVREHAGRSRAFVKIQDGCDCFCSFCIVPYARPQKISKPKQILLAEIKNLIAGGYREIVLSGINIGNYKCPQSGADLADTLPDIFALNGNFRIRFSSIELNTITNKLLEAAAGGGLKFCNYFHIPLQSGSNAVLKDMRRKYDAREYFERIEYIRGKIKNASIFCDVIAGYPTETQQDFDASLKFLDEVKFAGLHVFSFSPRSGTPAASLKQLPPAEIKKRADILRAEDKKLRAAFAQSLVGTEQQFLAEEETSSTVSGIAANFQRIIIKGAQKTNNLEKVKIISATDGICYGILTG